MRWIDRLERRFGRYGIPNLMNAILIGQFLVWFLILFVNKDLLVLLPLYRDGLAHGQIWRVVSFLFLPPLTTSILQLLLTLYFRWWVGNALERAWGDFRFLVYLVIGVIGAVLSCLISGAGSASGIFLSLFFAYAWMWPDQQVLLFFVIPIRMKWMGYAAAAVWVLEFLQGGLSAKVSLLFGIAGFLVFFGPEMFHFIRQEIVSYRRRRDWEKRTGRK
ncbi:MAG: rhomboid family intramembrane serine protease [Gemmiger sp.]|uniref:rhomboid family intramembrane serine protease n=1 Tax=Gemmiger sp. TaxID=2049027 RepID=UPI002E75CF3B|nr:rhomboid family intramembrane serine protease [Gemmiger sp.]MEE0801577.1 rhomboid family intramembrane serine protease [Gemmiger sp.]